MFFWDLHHQITTLSCEFRSHKAGSQLKIISYVRWVESEFHTYIHAKAENSIDMLILSSRPVPVTMSVIELVPTYKMHVLPYAHINLK